MPPNRCSTQEWKLYIRHLYEGKRNGMASLLQSVLSVWTATHFCCFGSHSAHKAPVDNNHHEVTAVTFKGNWTHLTQSIFYWYLKAIRATVNRSRLPKQLMQLQFFSLFLTTTVEQFGSQHALRVFRSQELFEVLNRAFKSVLLCKNCSVSFWIAVEWR